MQYLKQKFFQVDGPTWLVALALYAAWVLLVWFNARLPWWVIMPVGAYLIAWHFSLQHEAIHSFRGVPAWLRFAVVFPPLGLWFPYPLYRKSHTTHHRDIHLTIPGVDPESYYVRQADWASMGPAQATRADVQSRPWPGDSFDRSHPSPVESHQQGITARAARRLQSSAALGSARGRSGHSLLVHFGSLRFSMVAVLPARGLSWFELGVVAGLHGTSGGGGLSGANRLRGIECVIRIDVPL